MNPLLGATKPQKNYISVLLVTLFALALAQVAAPVAYAAPQPGNPATCQPIQSAAGLNEQAVTFPWQALAPAAQAQLPAARSHSQPLAGRLFWPAHMTERLPAVVLLHGSGGNLCDLLSSAALLAARGYVTLSITQPDNHSKSSETSGVEALASALVYLASPASPVRVQPHNAALIGHSEGAGVVSIAQGLPGFEDVQAVIALDNLRHWLTGDPGAAVRSCSKTPAGQVLPRVPALGFAKDGPCSASPDTSASLKLSGWNWWRAHHVAAAEVVPAGYGHLTFTDRRATPAQINWQNNLMADWLGSWLKHDTAALSSFNRPTPDLKPQQLSKHYHSAVYLPGQFISSDLRKDWRP